jgi:NAD(P)-dependent dehydrogenase (short-subunit alcohol dehydrogenase family)
MTTFGHYPSLEDKVVFITGGGSGIGAAIVEHFALNHARVAFIDIQDEVSEQLVRKLSGVRHRPLFIHADITDIAALRGSIDRVRRELGKIGVLVNNAANDDRHVTDEITPEYWDRVQNINLRPHFFTAQAIRHDMRELGGGSIVNFSSISWMAGSPGLVAYATAKAAIVGLTNTLARELGPDNIRVNCIAPGAVVTERQLRLWYNEEQADATAKRQLIQRRLVPVDLARTVLFLASDDSQMITKQCFVVDAGIR